MALSDDQKAMLRLLAQRGAAGYDDLTALMGLSAPEVHERAKAAAAQLETEGIPAPSIPAPGGSSKPAAPVQPPEPEPVATPEPQAPVPPTPAEASSPAPAAAPLKPRSNDPQSPKTSGSRPKLALPSSAGARGALAAGLAIVVALIVIFAVSGGDDSGDTTTASSGDGAAEEPINTSANPKLTQAVLDPIDGGDAKGVATFGRVKNSLALQVEAEGLDPTEQGDSYTIWLYESPQKMLPLASTTVGEDGRIGAQVEVPTEVLAYLANETFDQLDISLTTDATLKASLAKATKEKEAPLYTGTDVLRGTITGPIIGAASR